MSTQLGELLQQGQDVAVEDRSVSRNNDELDRIGGAVGLFDLFERLSMWILASQKDPAVGIIGQGQQPAARCNADDQGQQDGPYPVGDDGTSKFAGEGVDLTIGSDFDGHRERLELPVVDPCSCRAVKLASHRL